MKLPPTEPWDLTNLIPHLTEEGDVVEEVEVEEAEVGMGEDGEDCSGNASALQTRLN